MAKLKSVLSNKKQNVTSVDATKPEEPKEKPEPKKPAFGKPQKPDQDKEDDAKPSEPIFKKKVNPLTDPSPEKDDEE